MGRSCQLKPRVINQNTGLEEDSKLFDDLLLYSSNDREFAKQYYFVGTHPVFLNYNQGNYSVNEQGEISFESLKDLTHFSIDNFHLEEILREQIGEGQYTYADAISIIQGFNLYNPYNKEYMATMTPIKGDQVQVKLVKRSSTEEANLQKAIASRNLVDRIKARVTGLGGDITFIDSQYSTYSTQNAEELANGLFNVIKLSKQLSGHSLTIAASQAAGHFAVGALKNHPLTQRLLSACNEDVQKKILEEHPKENPEMNAQEYAAGILVSQYIQNQVDKQNKLFGLLGRFVDFVKRTFYKLRKNQVALDMMEAQKAAKNLALEFMTNPNFDIYDYSIEDSFGDNITFNVAEKIPTEAEDSQQIKTFKDIVKSLNVLTAELSSIDKDLFRKFHDIEIAVSQNRLELLNNPSLGNMIAFNGIVEAASLLADTAEEVIELLVNIDTDDMSDLQRNAKAARIVHYYLQHVNEIMSAIISLDKSGMLGSEVLEKKLWEYYNRLDTLINGRKGVQNTLIDKERKMFLNFITDLYGKDYISMSSRMLFGAYKDKKGKTRIGLHNEAGFTKESKIYLQKILNETDRDSSFQNRWLTSMASSSDIINQLAYMAKAAAQSSADTLTVQIWDDIRLLEQEAKDLGINTDRLLERYDDGTISGNYISNLHWGKYEDAFKAFKKQSEQEFLEAYPQFKNSFSIDKEVAFDQWFTPKLKQWHKENSSWNDLYGRWFPKKEVYENKAYDELSDKEKKYLSKILDKKGELDNLIIPPEDTQLPAHSHLWRMPQFRGSNNNRIQNLKATMGYGKATTKALRSSIINAFVANANDRDFGSEATNNSLDSSIFNEEHLMRKHNVSRVPLYGINKFDDPKELSTDLFAGLVQYGAMAATYQATSSVIDILEVGKNALGERKIEGQVEKTRLKHSYTYSRYIDFLDMNFYNLYARKTVWEKLIPTKIAATFNSLASKIYLGGNVHGGLRNALVGFLEITKEAISGQYFTVAEVKKAHEIYLANLIPNLLEAGEPVKNNKVSLFMRHFDVGSKTQENVMEYSTRKHKLVRLNPFGDNLLLPYKSGDHYMQAMSYLAVAQHYKFELNGEVITMWDAFEAVPIDPSNPKAGKKLQLKEGAMFIDPETGERRLWEGGQEEVNQSNADHLKYTMLCREVNNRMHGIYNKMDKPALAKSWYGQLILSMKGYALGYLVRRFGSNQQNLALGQDVEGTMLTAFKVFVNMFQNPESFQYSLRMLVLPFGKGTEQMMRDMGFSPSQYRNMRKNWADYIIILLLALIKAITAKDDEEEEDKKKSKNAFSGGTFGGGGAGGKFNKKEPDESNKAAGILHYFSTGALNEEAAFNTPTGLFVEFNQLTNIGKPSAVSAAELFYEVGRLTITGEQYEQGEKEGQYKAWNKVTSYIPWYRTYKILSKPYQATENYEYGRRAK